MPDLKPLLPQQLATKHPPKLLTPITYRIAIMPFTLPIIMDNYHILNNLHVNRIQYLVHRICYHTTRREGVRIVSRDPLIIKSFTNMACLDVEWLGADRSSSHISRVLVPGTI